MLFLHLCLHFANILETVHNDFRRQRGIFDLFQDLAVPDLDQKISAPEADTAATTNGDHMNGETGPKVNGDKADAETTTPMPNGTHNTGAGPSVQFED